MVVDCQNEFVATFIRIEQAKLFSHNLIFYSIIPPIRFFRRTRPRIITTVSDPNGNTLSFLNALPRRLQSVETEGYMEGGANCVCDDQLNLSGMSACATLPWVTHRPARMEQKTVRQLFLRSSATHPTRQKPFLDSACVFEPTPAS